MQSACNTPAQLSLSLSLIVLSLPYPVADVIAPVLATPVAPVGHPACAICCSPVDSRRSIWVRVAQWRAPGSAPLAPPPPHPPWIIHPEKEPYHFLRVEKYWSGSNFPCRRYIILDCAASKKLVHVLDFHLTKGSENAGNRVQGAAALFVLCVERPFSPWSQLAPGGQETEAGKRSPVAVDFPFSSPGGGGCRCSYKIPERERWLYKDRKRAREWSFRKAPAGRRLSPPPHPHPHSLFGAFVILHTCVSFMQTGCSVGSRLPPPAATAECHVQHATSLCQLT